MNAWIPKVGKVAFTIGVSVLDEVKEKGCPVREKTVQTACISL